MASSTIHAYIIIHFRTYKLKKLHPFIRSGKNVCMLFVPIFEITTVRNRYIQVLVTCMRYKNNNNNNKKKKKKKKKQVKYVQNILLRARLYSTDNNNNNTKQKNNNDNNDDKDVVIILVS